MEFPVIHRGPRFGSTHRLALAETPDGLVLVQRGGWRGGKLVWFRLGEGRWEGPWDVGIDVRSGEGVFAWWDDGAWAAVQDRDRLCARRLDGGAAWEIAAPGYEPTQSRALRAVVAAGGRLVAIGEAGAWAVGPGGAVLLPGWAGRGALAAGAGRVVAVATGGVTCAELLGDRWAPLPDLPAPARSGVVYHRGTGRFVVLAGGADATAPYALGAAWAPCGPALPDALDGGAALGWDPRGGRAVVVGGEAADRARSSARAPTRDLDTGEAFGSPWDASTGAWAVVTGGEELLLVDRDLGAVRRVGDGLVALVPPAPYAAWFAMVDPRAVLFAANGATLWALGRQGRVWRADLSDGGLGPWADQGTAPARLPLGFGAGLAWDAPRERLVLVGADRHATWTWTPAAGWSLLAGAKLPREAVVITATPAGVYARSGGSLFLLGDDGWPACAGYAVRPDPDDIVVALAWDPGREALLAVHERRAPPAPGAPRRGPAHVVCLLAPDGERVLGELPGPLYAVVRDSLRFGVAAGGGPLLWFGEAEVRAVALDAVPARAGLPAPAPRKAPRRAALPRPPPPVGRTALRLVATGRGADVAAVPVPPGHVLLAWLPAGEALPLGAHASLAVTLDADALWSGAEGEDPTERAVGLHLLPHAPSGTVVAPRGRPVYADVRAFRDDDPLAADAAPNPDEAVRTSSKIGGYAALLHGGDEEQARADTRGACPTCGQPRRFRVQLAADLFAIGDAGRLYVYVCPAGCTAGADVESA